MAPQVSEDDDMEFESLGKGGEWAEGISKGTSTISILFSKSYFNDCTKIWFAWQICFWPLKGEKVFTLKLSLVCPPSLTDSWHLMGPNLSGFNGVCGFCGYLQQRIHDFACFIHFLLL